MIRDEQDNQDMDTHEKIKKNHTNNVMTYVVCCTN
jgi:hypothetical protein